MEYPVRLLKTEEGYAVWCPSLPGCASQGDTEQEALDNIREAIQMYIEVGAELEEDLPEGTQLLKVVA